MFERKDGKNEDFHEQVDYIMSDSLDVRFTRVPTFFIIVFPYF